MTNKESQHKWYLKHRDEQITRVRAYQAKHIGEHRQQALAYYYAHRDERLTYQKEHYRKHREGCITYSKEYRRKSCVISKEQGKYIRGVIKATYPIDKKCSFCKRTSHRSLQWHHWDDGCPEDGFWICISCHTHIEALFKKAPNKAEFINYIKFQLSTSSIT